MNLDLFNKARKNRNESEAIEAALKTTHKYDTMIDRTPMLLINGIDFSKCDEFCELFDKLMRKRKDYLDETFKNMQ